MKDLIGWNRGSEIFLVDHNTGDVGKKISFWSTHFFGDVPLLPISKNSLQAPSLDYIFFGKFTLSNLIFLVEELIGWNRGFEIFLIDHNTGDVGKKISLVSIKKFLYQCHPPNIRRVSSHGMLYL